MNDKNLIHLSKRSPEERKAIQEKGRKANKAKIEARKTLKEELLLLLSEKDNQKKMSVALIKEAQSGNTKAFEVIRDTIGEKVTDNLNVNGSINNPFSGLSTEELRKLIND